MERLAGAVVSGVSDGAYFVGLAWVRDAIRRIAGFDPYPGTLNVRLLGTETLLRWRGILKSAGISFMPPDPGSCGGRLLPVVVGDRIRAAVVIPDLTRYEDEVLEVIAPVHLRTALGLQDGDPVALSVENEPEVEDATR